MHNYEKKIARLMREGKVPSEIGKTYSCKVGHDDWCAGYKGGECNCDPEISYVEVTQENREQIAERIAKDSKEFRQKMKDKMI